MGLRLGKQALEGKRGSVFVRCIKLTSSRMQLELATGLWLKLRTIQMFFFSLGWRMGTRRRRLRQVLPMVRTGEQTMVRLGLAVLSELVLGLVEFGR